MKYAMMTLIVVLGTANLMGCGGSKDNGGGGAAYSYTLTDPTTNCTTGTKTFATQAAMCTALQDPSQNNNCAWQQRQTYYQQNCQNVVANGTTPQTYPQTMGQAPGQIGQFGSIGQQQYSYNYTLNFNGQTCTTGQQNFSNIYDYCTALIDDMRNNNCANIQRRNDAMMNCNQVSVYGYGAGYGMGYYRFGSQYFDVDGM